MRELFAQKKPVFFGAISLSPGLMVWMDERSVQKGALHIYRLDISKSDRVDAIPYCTIIELHSPQYLSDEWLRALYEDQYAEFSVISPEAAALLTPLSTLIQKFPSR